MNKDKKSILFIVILFILIFLILLFLVFFDDGENGQKYNDLCRQINNAKKNQKDFIVVVNSEELTEGIVYELKERHNLIIYEIKRTKILNNCFAESLNDTGEYDRFRNDHSSAVVAYKSGTYVGLIGGQASIESIESYLTKLTIIEKEKIKEDLTYEKYKEKIEFDEYYLIAITEEDVREKIELHMKKIFPHVRFDIINIYGDEGSKIITDIKEIVEVNSYSRIFYFKKGKLIAEDKGATEIHLEQFKEKLEKLD